MLYFGAFYGHELIMAIKYSVKAILPSFVSMTIATLWLSNLVFKLFVHPFLFMSKGVMRCVCSFFPPLICIVMAVLNKCVSSN